MDSVSIRPFALLLFATHSDDGKLPCDRSGHLLLVHEERNAGIYSYHTSNSGEKHTATIISTTSDSNCARVCVLCL